MAEKRKFIIKTYILVVQINNTIQETDIYMVQSHIPHNEKYKT